MSEKGYSYREDSDGEEERIKSIRQGLSNQDFGKDRRKTAAAAVVLISTTAIFYGLSPPKDEQRVTDRFSGETVNVTIGNRYIDPNRPTLKPEDRLRFKNNADFSYAMRFESGVETFVLEPGESRIVNIDGITHYNATPLPEGRRAIKAGIYVER